MTAVRGSLGPIADGLSTGMQNHNHDASAEYDLRLYIQGTDRGNSIY